MRCRAIVVIDEDLSLKMFLCVCVCVYVELSWCFGWILLDIRGDTLVLVATMSGY